MSETAQIKLGYHIEDFLFLFRKYMYSHASLAWQTVRPVKVSKLEFDLQGMLYPLIYVSLDI